MHISLSRTFSASESARKAKCIRMIGNLQNINLSPAINQSSPDKNGGKLQTDDNFPIFRQWNVVNFDFFFMTNHNFI